MSKVDNCSHLPWKGEKLSYSRLPQGFIHSPHIFDQILKIEIQLQSDPRAVCIQYVDAILVGHETYEGCLRKTEEVLKELHKIGMKVSKDKLVVAEKNVVYLGRKISKGKKGLADKNIETIKLYKKLSIVKEMMGFLGTTGFCSEFIPEYAEKSQRIEGNDEKGRYERFESITKVD